MEHLLTVENKWDRIVGDGGPRESITEMEVERATGHMKSGKADGL